MNATERLQKAIAGQPTDVPAVAPAYLALYLDSQVQNFYRQLYQNKIQAQSSALASGVSIDHAEDTRLRAEAILRAYGILDAEQACQSPSGDWLHTYAGESRAWAARGEMRWHQGRLFYCDQESGSLESMDEPGRLTAPTTTRYMYRPSHGQPSGADLWDESAGLRSTADIDQLLPLRSTAALAAEGAFDLTRVLAERVAGRLPLSCIAPTPFWSTYSLLGFQGMMIMMREQPELFTYLMERRGRQYLELLAGFVGAGVRYVWLEECLSSADLISARDYQRFAFATAAPYIAEAQRLGLTVILYYCGDVISRLPWLKRLGMDALAVEESKKGFAVDIGRVIEAAGDVCCVFGNVDAVQVMLEGTREAIRAEVERQIALGRQARGFVVCQGSPFTLDTPIDKVAWFVQCARTAAV